MVITTVTKVSDRVVPPGATTVGFTVRLDVAWAMSMGWVLTDVSAARVKPGPVTMTVRGVTTIPVTVNPAGGSQAPANVGITGRARSEV